MKKLDKELSTLLMEYESCTSSRTEFDVVCRMEELISNKKKSMYTSEDGRSYYAIVNNIMMNDIAEFLESYRVNNKVPGYKYYSISTNYLKTDARTGHLTMHYDSKKIKLHKFNHKVSSFPQYTIYKILGLEESIPNYKFAKYLLKDEYDKFIQLRIANSMYFIPFIQELIDDMNNKVEEI